MPAVTNGREPTVYLQGIEVPASTVNNELFFANTRRRVYQEVNESLTLGSPSAHQIRRQGLLAGLEMRVYGTVTVDGAPGSDTTTRQWPYNLIRNLRVNVNGQSHLINCDGLTLKARACMMPDSTDRGVVREVNGGAVDQGTYSLSAEDWGSVDSTTLLGSGSEIPSEGTYAVDLYVYIPLAMDEQFLAGALFLQTAATNINVDIDWAPLNSLFIADASEITANLSYQLHSVSYAIPVIERRPIVPQTINVFHSLINVRNTAFTAGAGQNEFDLPGTGIGRQLQRVWFQVWNGQVPEPLPVNAANYGKLSWMYGGNEIPESVANGQVIRTRNERLYNCDHGNVWGTASWDFANEWAFRDAVDEGDLTDLRLGFEIPGAVDLTNHYQVVTQETMFSAASGA